MKRCYVTLILLVTLSVSLLGCSEKENSQNKQEGEVNVTEDKSIIREGLENTESNESELDIYVSPSKVKSEEVGMQKSDLDIEQETNEDNKLNEGNKSVEVDIEYIKNNLTNGLTQEQIIELFKKKPDKKGEITDGSFAWQYNFGTVKDYHFDEVGIDVAEGNISPLDVEGIIKKDIEVDLIIGFDENNKINTFVAGYLDEKGDVKAYAIYSDGLIKEDLVQKN